MRMATFVIVGALGFVVQMTILAGLLSAGCPYLVAIAVAVEAAVLHNFLWHERWTWADRTCGAPGAATRLLRFNLTTGSTSITGNLAFTALYVGVFGLNPVAANALAVASTAAANFVIADRCVFAALTRTVATILILGWPSHAGAAQLRKETIDAWDQYVKATEARIERDLAHAPRPAIARPEGELPDGGVIAVPSGLIHHWHGGVFIRGMRLDTFLDALIHPGTPPPQEDVLEARVLARSNDALRVYLRLVRKTIITVTYNTEHEMTFRRRAPLFATSRSVATKIAEVEGAGTRDEHELGPGDDRGFLWRLNSYWRYTETNGGVWVQLESLTLSRNLPGPVRSIATPIVNSVARESMTRTLQSMARWLENRAHIAASYREGRDGLDANALERWMPAARMGRLRLSDRLDGDPCGLEAGAHSGGKGVRTLCIAVQADGIRFQRDDRSVRRHDAGIPHHSHGARHDETGVVNDGAGLAARHQPPIRLVGAIGEDLCGDAQTRRVAGLQDL